MKLSEILTGPEKWIKQDYWEHGRSCLMGGIHRLVEGEPDLLYTRERARLERIIGLPDDRSVEDWNDAPERTWDDVALVIAEYDRDRMLNP